MKILFMGTPEFAEQSLKALIEAGHAVCGVFTQPDKPKGRGYKLTEPPVKILAKANHIPVFQPETLKNEAALEILRELDPELIAVVAYGKILPDYVLNYPKYGCINVHGSLLPKYRGAGPIQWAVINGEQKTGVCTMYMASALDAGDIIECAETQVGEYETAGELHERLKVIGAELLLNTIRLIEDGKAPRIKQDDTLASYAPMLTKQTARINWKSDAIEIIHLICGCNPWPVAHFCCNGMTMKLFSAAFSAEDTGLAPGTVCGIDPGLGIKVACGQGSIVIRELQKEGGKRMKSEEFLRGNPIKIGTVFE